MMTCMIHLEELEQQDGSDLIVFQHTPSSDEPPSSSLVEDKNLKTRDDLLLAKLQYTC
jgi:hypothetical protein